MIPISTAMYKNNLNDKHSNPFPSFNSEAYHRIANSSRIIAKQTCHPNPNLGGSGPKTLAPAIHTTGHDAGDSSTSSRVRDRTFTSEDSSTERLEMAVSLPTRAPGGPGRVNGQDGTTMSGNRDAGPFRGHSGMPTRDTTFAQGNTPSRMMELGVVCGIAMEQLRGGADGAERRKRCIVYQGDIGIGMGLSVLGTIGTILFMEDIGTTERSLMENEMGTRRTL